MKNMKQLCLYGIIALNTLVATEQSNNSVPWAVIGAGPAGIVIVGLLLDLGFTHNDIIWVDPEFNVGRIGQYYQTVPGNTKTSLYIDFINSCKTFQECSAGSLQKLLAYQQDKEYPLGIIFEPLQEITRCMQNKVIAYQATLTGLEYSADLWHIELSDGHECAAERVVLATGSHPRSLQYQECTQEIPLDYALNKEALAHYITPEDTIAVVGSAHSAVLVLKFLSELDAGRIINFYKNPLIYTQDMGGWLLYSSSGLKGVAAQWAKNVLEKNPPCNLLRMYNSENARRAWLPICTKIIYAAGYERNPIPGCSSHISYDTHTGIIAPGLFGIGIAFPEVIVDQAGNTEHKIGLNSFMQHALDMLPLWSKGSPVFITQTLYKFRKFEELFDIHLL